MGRMVVDIKIEEEREMGRKRWKFRNFQHPPFIDGTALPKQLDQFAPTIYMQVLT
jgi:hypothetical protein